MEWQWLYMESYWNVVAEKQQHIFKCSSLFEYLYSTVDFSSFSSFAGWTNHTLVCARFRFTSKLLEIQTNERIVGVVVVAVILFRLFRRAAAAIHCFSWANTRDDVIQVEIVSNTYSPHSSWLWCDRVQNTTTVQTLYFLVVFTPCFDTHRYTLNRRMEQCGHCDVFCAHDWYIIRIKTWNKIYKQCEIDKSNHYIQHTRQMRLLLLRYGKCVCVCVIFFSSLFSAEFGPLIDAATSIERARLTLLIFFSVSVRLLMVWVENILLQ